MNLLAIVQRLHREAGFAGAQPSAAAGSSSADVLRLVDWSRDCWRMIQQKPRNWRWMQATALGDVVAAAPQYTLDALLGSSNNRFSRWRPQNDVYRPTVYEASAPSNEQPLEYLTYDQYVSMFVVGSPTGGMPAYWSTAPNGDLLLGPTPDRALKIRIGYFKSPLELTADADSPDMPDEFHMAVVWGALSKYGAFDAAPEVITRAADEWSEIYNELSFRQGEQMTLTGRDLAPT